MEIENTINTQVEPVVHLTPNKIETDKKLFPISYYAQQIRPLLPKEIFSTHPQRIFLFLSYVVVAVTCFYFLTQFSFNIFIKFFLSIILGTCFGAFGFFVHEMLHGSIVRNKKIQDFFGFIGMMPWFISPTFWRYWHNHLHHGKTQAIIHDPDAFPTLKIFKHSGFMKFMYPFTPGSGHKRSYLYFFLWFSVHAFVAQTYLRFRNSVYSELNHKRVTLEMSGQIIIWVGIHYFIGFEHLFWTFLIPLFAQNYFALSYIATNHNLSPLTKVNDPLINSLTVTNNPILEKLHLQFGYHVEHHIFPAVSGVHAKLIHETIKKEFPDRFLFMTKYEAIKLLYKTARIYKNSTTLMNPETGETYPTYSKL